MTSKGPFHDDAEQEKKVLIFLNVFNCSFLSSLGGGGHSFFKFFKGGLLITSSRNPALTVNAKLSFKLLL